VYSLIDFLSVKVGIVGLIALFLSAYEIQKCKNQLMETKYKKKIYKN